MYVQENSSAQPGEGAEDGSVSPTQEYGRRWSIPPLHFSFDYKTVAP